MTFSQAIPAVFGKYATFNGRADRSEFWWFYLFVFIVGVVLGSCFTLTGIKFFNWLSYIFSLAVLIPEIAVAVRRMHDINKSGLWVLINFVPLIGWIWFIVLAAKPSDPNPNQYGPVPADF